MRITSYVLAALLLSLPATSLADHGEDHQLVSYIPAYVIQDAYEELLMEKGDVPPDWAIYLMECAERNGYIGVARKDSQYPFCYENNEPIDEPEIELEPEEVGHVEELDGSLQSGNRRMDQRQQTIINNFPSMEPAKHGACRCDATYGASVNNDGRMCLDVSGAVVSGEFWKNARCVDAKPWYATALGIAAIIGAGSWCMAGALTSGRLCVVRGGGE